MSTNTLGLFLRHLALSEEVGRLGTARDEDLLAAYESGRGEAAFTELMRRYGPMVLRTCCRILGHSPDAEDAFQATSVLLARKAAQLYGEAARPLSLGGWLHRVASQTALNVLSQSSRRRARERQACSMSHPDPDPATEATWNEVRPILDAELNALPEEARRLLIACYLQGKTHAEAAAELGLPLGSLARRLEKARGLLAERLVRRGITVPATLLAVLLGELANGAGVPAVLLVHTVEAARTLTEQTAGTISDNVAQLVKCGLARMANGSTHLSMALIGWVGLLGAGLIIYQTLKAWPDRTPESEPPAVERAAQEDRLTRSDRFGDPMPPGALTRLGTVRWRHTTGLFLMAFTHDGKGLVTAGAMNPARLWDVATGKKLRQVGDEWEDRGLIIAFSPDGRIVAGKVRSTGELGLWDTATGTLLRRLTGMQAWANWPLAFSPDGKTLAAVDRKKGTLRLWEAATDKQRWGVQLKVAGREPQRSQQFPDKLLFSADGKSLIWGSWKGGVHLCDAATGKELRRWDDDKRRSVSALTAAPNGRLFAVCHPAAGTAGRSACLWEMATGKEVWQVGAEDEEWSNTAAAFSPDGKILAIGHLHGSIHLWDAATGKELRRCNGCPGAVLCLAFSPDGKTLVSGGGGTLGCQNQMVRFWDTDSGREIRHSEDGHRAAVVSVAFAPDGKDIVSGGWEGSVRVWNAANGEQQRQILAAGENFFSGRPASITTALSPDGKSIASGVWQRNFEERKAWIQFRLWDRSNGRELRRWSQELGNYAPISFAFSPDGKTVACATWKAPLQVHLWEAATGKELATVAGSYAAFSPDGKLLATAPEPVLAQGKKGGRGWFSLWETATAKELCSVPVLEGYVQRLLFSPDGRTLATASSRSAAPNKEPSVIHLWPLFRDETRKMDMRIDAPRVLAAKGPSVVDVLDPGFGAWAFSPDGRTLALSGDGAIRLLETASGKERIRFTGHGSDVMALSFSPDGRRLASGGRDTTILIWDATGRLQNGHLLGTLLSAKQLEEYWADLAGEDAARAGRAIWTLAADPVRAAPYLAEQLRAAAAEAKEQLAGVPQLIRDLDDNNFPVRENAKMELARLGEAAELALRQALAKSPSPEKRRSLEQLLKEVEVNRQALSGEPLRAVRAVEVLEQISAEEAREALKALAAGAPEGSVLAREAHAALERAGRQ